MLEPSKRAACYQLNGRMPNVALDPQSIVDMWIKGYITEEQSHELLKRHGIPFGKESVENDNEVSNEFKHLAGWHKFAAYAKGRVPGVGECQELYNRQLIKDTDWAKWLRRNGVLDKAAVDAFKALAHNIYDLPTNIVLLNRGLMSEEQFKGNLHWLGWRSAGSQNALRQLANAIPGPGDLVSFAVKEVWDKEVVKAFGYDDEFPPEFQKWMKKQGYGWPILEEGEFDFGETPMTWAIAYWRSHWQTLSPSMAYVLMQRVRGNPDDPASWRIPGVKPFTIDDVRRVLKIADYPKPFRDRLAAVSYSPISRMDVRRLLQTGVIDQKEVGEVYQDHGLTKANADNLAEAIVRQDRIRRFRAVTDLTKGKVISAYKIGAINEEQAVLAMHRLTLEDPNKLREFNAADKDVQVGVARGNQLVKLVIDDIKTERRIERIKKWVAVLHRKYVKGIIEKVDVIRETGILGMDAGYVDDMLKEWNTEKLFVKRELSASQAIKAYTRGIINEPQLLQRLQNLEYKNQDISIMIVQARQDLAVAIAKAQEKAARSLAQQQKAQLAQIKAAQQEIKRKQAALSKHSSPEKMHKWYVRGFIDRPRVINRLAFLGWTRDDIDRTLAEWDSEIAGKRGKQEEKTAKAIAATRRHATASEIKKWFKDGVIDEKTLRIELAERGYVKDYSDRVVKDIEEEKHAKASKSSGGSADGEAGTK